jgi:MATE family multidrug resistance protein
MFARIFGASMPFVSGYFVLRSYATALSRPNAALVVMALQLLFNGFADYVLIFGHFGLPALGLKGAAIASLSSNLFAFFAMTLAVFAHPLLRHYKVFSSFIEPHWAKLAEVFRLGIPIGITLLFEVLFFSSGTLIMGHFGAVAVAAHQIALTTASTTFMVPLGIAMAATVRVGLAAGARDWPRVRRAGAASVALGTGFMAICAGVIATVPHCIASLFIAVDLPENQTVAAMAVTFLYFAAGFQLMDALQVTASLSLRGLKDATMPMWLAGGSYWLIGFPTAIGLSFGTDLQGVGVWIAFGLALAVAAATLSARFAILSGMIRSSSVILHGISGAEHHAGDARDKPGYDEE